MEEVIRSIKGVLGINQIRVSFPNFLNLLKMYKILLGLKIKQRIQLPDTIAWVFLSIFAYIGA